mmetsp:Transcript_48934/g.96830  ORF Transcript_48934/g.96830 Transcript_48934/m.96830 type:complete len:279 (+) Transcript_48934:67-903(+)
MHPIDTLKTRKMSQDSSDGSGDADDEALDLSPRGIQDLYRGVTANLLKEGPPSGIYLGIYETIKNALLVDPHGGGGGGAGFSPLVVYLIAGSVGEFFGSMIRAPSEAAKTRIQSGLAPDPFHAFQALLKEPALLLNTWSVSLARDVPFGAIQIALFELSKSAILTNPDIDVNVNSFLSEAVLGLIAGGIGALVTTPADVVITRLISEDKSPAMTTRTGEEPSSPPPSSPLEMTKRIYEEGGVGAFFNGAGARVGYWAPSIAIFLSLYCQIRTVGLSVL